MLHASCFYYSSNVIWWFDPQGHCLLKLKWWPERIFNSLKSELLINCLQFYGASSNLILLMLILLNRGIQSARHLDGSSLPEKIWLKVKLLRGLGNYYKTFWINLSRSIHNRVTFVWFLAATIFYWGQRCNSCPWAHETLHGVRKLYWTHLFEKQPYSIFS